MNRRYLCATVAAASLFGGAFVAVTWLAPAPHLLWNASASAPIGLYRIDADARPLAGDLVAIEPPLALGDWLAQRGYLPRGVPLLKRVAGVPGQRICRTDIFVTIDGHGAARARARDRLGRPLPKWLGCRIIGRGEYFLLNAAPDSLDGRYFGAISDTGLIGVAQPIWTRAAPGAPLRCRQPGTHPTPTLKQTGE